MPESAQGYGWSIFRKPAMAEVVDLYLARHPEYDPGSEGRRRFLTTGRADAQNGLVEQFWGQPLAFDAA